MSNTRYLSHCLLMSILFGGTLKILLLLCRTFFTLRIWPSERNKKESIDNTIFRRSKAETDPASDAHSPKHCDEAQLFAPRVKKPN
jgi:hypothetical protein